MPDRIPTTRLAPSPTGALHLGNARTFVVNWIMARQRGWRIVMRMEDLDGPRVKTWAVNACYDILTWLGLDWDEGPLTQSADMQPYREAMHRLAATGAAYPCELTRREIEEARSAPHPGEASRENWYDPALRPPLHARDFDDAGDANWRYVTPDRDVAFEDAFAGPQSWNPGRTTGDFVVWTRHGQPAYQLAVVIDDHRQGVTQVVRGDDLLDSAARQMLLYEALELGSGPTWRHLPLVVGEDGRRLAKRHGDTRLATYREAGVRAERVLGLLACWCGMMASPDEISLAEFVEGFNDDKMPRDPIVFDAEADAWLRE
ncbi:glutamate--tRNA ligase family protein [Pyruvatibacter sp.]|uniref:glutamate--tRNA ligase family protein n=1 Tax=Pyruvatibacter sp. TaxID=1981328 RepID=UPI0032EB9E3F